MPPKRQIKKWARELGIQPEVLDSPRRALRPGWAAQQRGPVAQRRRAEAAAARVSNNARRSAGALDKVEVEKMTAAQVKYARRQVLQAAAELARAARRVLK